MSTFSPIAVVGLGCIMPGALDVPSFWRNTLEKRDLITDIPRTHWLVEDYYDPNPKAPDKTYARRGAFLPDVPFDAMGFGIPPSTLPATDTSQLIALIVAQMVLDDVSRLGARTLDLSRTSVILGVTGAQELLSSLVSRLQRPVWERSLRLSGLDEQTVQEACDRIASHYVGWQEASFPGLLGNVVAGRIANRLDTGGTNCITDAACASALTAVQTAIYELQLGHSDMAITGGCDTLNDIFMHMCFSKTPALSPTGDCRPFSDEADGTLLGEGLGMLALKRLEDAERDDDRIYAVIRGLGSSSDGRSKSVYAPVSEGQAKALNRCYEQAGYSPATVDMVEGHGTGTKAGDAAELKGLNLVFQGTRGDTRWCALGSVKSQLGHTKAAAGAAGLMKVVLALHHKVIPPTIKVKKPNTLVDWAKSPFYLATEARPWITGRGHARRASVSSFGFGGTNFHVTVEEYLGPATHPERMDRWGAEILPFSGGTVGEVEAALNEALAVARALPAGASLMDRAVALLTKQVQDRFDAAASTKPAVRLSVLVTATPTGWDLAAKLGAALDALRGGKSMTRGGVWFQPGVDAGKVAFLFPGQGSQYLEMGKGLAMDVAAARGAWDEADACFPEHDRLSFTVFPRPSFTDEDQRSAEQQLVRTEWAQPAIGVASVAMLRVLATHGLTPDVSAGHSFGELTALYAAGALSYPDYVRASRRRGELMAEAAKVPGAMAAVVAKPADVAEELRSLAKAGIEGVVIANYNSPEQTVIAGPTGALEAAVKHLDSAGYKAVRLSVATAFHSPVVAPAADAYAIWLRDLPFAEPRFPVYSNATGVVHGAGPLAVALGEHLRSPVRFVDEVEAMYNSGVRTFIEVGPSAVLTGLVGRCLRGRGHVAFATDARNTDSRVSLLSALGHAAAVGLPVRFAPLWAERQISALRPPPKMAVMINGSNYGKPYPSDQMLPVPPNPPRPSGGGGGSGLSSPSRPPNGVRPMPTSDLVVQVAAPPLAASPQVNRPPPPPPVSPMPPSDLSWVAAFLDSQKQAASVHEGFQRSMTDAHIAFLRSHEETSRVVVALAAGVPATFASPAFAPPAFAPSPVAVVVAPPVVLAPVALQPVPVAARPVAAATHAVAVVASSAQPVGVAVSRDLNALLLAVVSEKTGYPVEMLNLSMDLEADLGVDSIKRVEILSAMREREPSLPEVDAETMGALKTLGQVVSALGAATGPTLASGRTAPETARAPGAAGGRDLTALLLSVVSEKTGYPAEMLNLAMDLEADLGVDSIKRVEILSAMREREPSLPEVDAETMGALKTLAQVVGALGAVSVGGEAEPVRLAAVSPGGAVGVDLTALLLAVVAEKTGYPAEMLNLGMDLEADLGVDSIKRVEILSAMRERQPSLPEVDAETMGALKTLGQVVSALGAGSGADAGVANVATSSPLPAGVDLTTLLLAVVAEKTGYPAEMLNLGMDLEADLGVDSIKRVEILSAMREREPSLPEVDAETMGALKTLAQVVGALCAVSGALSHEGESRSTLSAGPASSAAVDPIGRYELQLLPLGAGTARTSGAMVVVGGGALGAAVAVKLREAGVDAREGDPDGAAGVLFLGGVGVQAVAGDGAGGGAGGADFDLAASVSRAAFAAAKKARLDGAGGFVTVTALGGDFGCEGTLAGPAMLGGLAGLTKTVALEHPAAFVRHIDLAPASVEIQASWIAQELLRTGPIEVGVSTRGRVTPGSWLALEATESAVLPLGPSDVVVVSGGARGVTAACIVALVERTKCKVVLLGRSRIDVAEEPEVAAALDEAALKRALFGLDRTLTPAAAGKQAAAVLAAREARSNITRMKAAGAAVRYVAVNVADGKALSAVLADVRAQWGPITGVVHGAGVIADKRLVEKSTAQFDAVYDTKIEGARALLEATRADPLKVLCFFSSVAGRAGNIGQCDYALANEALNKLAAAEKRARSGSATPTVVKAIGWGPWEGGMVTPALKKQFENLGIPCIPLARGAEIFVGELSGFSDATEIVVGGAPGPLSAPPPHRSIVVRTVASSSHSYLRDHTVDDRPVLPVVMALEWFVQRAGELRPGMAVTVEDVKVLKGVVLDHFDNGGDRFEVIATATGADRWTMELRSAKAVHYRGEVSVQAVASPPGAPERIAHEQFPHSVKEVYDRMLFHGPDFHVIRGISGMSAGGMEAELHGVVDAANWPGEGWSTDVAALDGGLQLVVLFTQLMTKRAALPTGIGSFRTFGLPKGGKLSAVLSARRTNAHNTVTDVALMDSAGRVVAELRGVEAHALPGGTYPVIATRTAALAK
ncbi:MAG: SDR family oxidoreductase [Myxococcales bacterium]|nr:SDR family oxidoreductase [Myxococcales bacterium]